MQANTSPTHGAHRRAPHRARQSLRAPERAVGYLRCSTDRQPVSLEAQRASIVRWAQERDISIVRWHVDDAISGASAVGRDGFQRMVAEIEQLRDVGSVLCYDVSRFGRTDNDEAGFYRHRLHAAGANVFYVAEASLTGSPADDLLLPMLQWQKRDALRALSRDTLRGLIGLAHRGAWCAGAAPFGYAREVRAPGGAPLRRVAPKHRSHCENGEYVMLVPGGAPEAAAVRLAWDLHWVDGLGFGAVRDRIAATGISPPRAATWRKSSVRALLRNAVYTGRLTYGLRPQGKFHRATPRGAVARPKADSGRFDPSVAEPIVVENAFEPLASERACAAFREWEFRERSRRIAGEPAPKPSARRRKSPWLLSGLVRCARCGSSFVGTRRTRRKATKAYVYEDYMCNGYHSSGRAGCVRYLIPARAFEAAVVRAVREAWVIGVSPPALRSRLEQQARDLLPPDTRTRVAEIEAQIASADHKMIEVARAIAAAHADVANLAIASMKAEREVQLDRLAEAQRGRQTHATVDTIVGEALRLVGELGEGWDGATKAQRKTVLSSFVHEILVDPEERSVTLALRGFPFEGAPPVSGVDTALSGPAQQLRIVR